ASSGSEAGNVWFQATNSPISGISVPVNISRTTGSAPVTFTVNADGSINTDSGTQIGSTDGSLHVQLNSGLTPQNFSTGSVNYQGQINTNGGNLDISGPGGVTIGSGSSIDLGTTGNAQISGMGEGVHVWWGTSIDAQAGNVVISVQTSND